MSERDLLREPQNSKLSADDYLSVLLNGRYPSGTESSQRNETPQRTESSQRADDRQIGLPTLHVHDSRVNVNDNYSVNSDVARLYMQNRPAVVRINTLDPRVSSGSQSSAGSGSIIDSSGIIATGYHVVKNASALWVQTADGAVYQARILDLDPAKEQALLKIESSNPWAVFPAVHLAADSKTAVEHSELVGFGFPGNQENMHVSSLSVDSRVSFSNLKVAGGSLLGEDPMRELIKTLGPVQKGDSGGPVFNPVTGEQEGIINLSDEANGAAYITPVEDLQAFLARTKAKYNTDSLNAGLPLRGNMPDDPQNRLYSNAGSFQRTGPFF